MCKFWDFRVLGSKFFKFLMSILNWQVNSSSNFRSFFVAMKHNSSVNFKHIHFLLWIKRSHQSPDFDTFECSGENLPNSSYHFPNHKSVFLQILHDTSLSWKITPPYFFRSQVIYFARRGQSKCKFFRLLSAWIKIHQLFVSFETTNCFFFQVFYHPSVSWDITTLYFFSWNFICCEQKKPIKVKISLQWAFFEPKK